MKSTTLIVCPLCSLHDSKTRHHVEPRSLYRERIANLVACGHEVPRYHPRTFMICRPCHDAIHHIFTHRELAYVYTTPEKIQHHPDMAQWIKLRRLNHAARFKGATPRKQEAERQEALGIVRPLIMDAIPVTPTTWTCGRCARDNPGSTMQCERCGTMTSQSYLQGRTIRMCEATIRLAHKVRVPVRYAGRTKVGRPIIVQMWNGAAWEACDEPNVFAAIAELHRSP